MMTALLGKATSRLVLGCLVAFFFTANSAWTRTNDHHGVGPISGGSPPTYQPPKVTIPESGVAKAHLPVKPCVGECALAPKPLGGRRGGGGGGGGGRHPGP